jgi:hypothetical protein
MLFKVTVNGETHVVEAPSKSTAGAWGNNQLRVNVEVATAADLKGLDLEKIPTALKGGKTLEVETPEAD